MGYIEASHSETSVVWGETMCLMCALVGHTSQICRDVSQANYWKLDFPAERVFHVTMNAVAKQQYCTSILHIDVNCVLTPFIYLVVMSYVTGMLLVTTLAAIRWHF